MIRMDKLKRDAKAVLILLFIIAVSFIYLILEIPRMVSLAPEYFYGRRRK